MLYSLSTGNVTE